MADQVSTHMFVCRRCLFETPHKHVLKAHLTKRKTPCTIVNNGENIETKVLLTELSAQIPINTRPKQTERPYVHACEFCQKTFTQSSNRYRHQSTCSQRENRAVVDRKVLTEELDNFKQDVVAILSNRVGNNVTNNIQNNKIQVNVQLPKDFGKENIEHIIGDKPFLTDCVLKLGTGIKDLIERIHFDESFPQNSNMKNLKKKQKTIEVMKDGKWEMCDQSSFLNDIINKGYKILYTHFLNEYADLAFQDRQEYIGQYFGRIGESVTGAKTHNEFWQLRKDVWVMIHNNTLYLMQKV
jgi:hypothetical protein